MNETADPAELRLLAARLRETGDWRGVADRCRALLESDAGNRATLVLLCNCLLTGRCYEELAHTLAPVVRAGTTDAVLLFRYAAAHWGIGDASTAARYYRLCTSLTPHDFEAWLNLGVAEKVLGRLDEAVAAYRRVLALKPGLPEVHNNLALVLRQQGDLDEALAMLDRAIALRRDYARAHANRGEVLLALDRLDEAEAASRSAIAFDPRLSNGHINLSLALMAQNRPTESRDVLRHLATLLPDDARTLTSLGVAEKECGNITRALELHRRAAALDPRDPTPHWNESHVRLLRGDIALGWERYETRWSTPQLAGSRRPWDAPVWNGEPLGARTLLVHAEQGVGESLQFCRLVPAIAARHPRARLMFEVQPSLRALIAHSFRAVERLEFHDQLGRSGRNLPPFDCHVPLLSVPRLLGIDLPDIPGEPYLEAPRPRRYRRDGDALVVGFSWKSLAVTAQKRSLSLAVMAQALARPGVRLVNLQYGDTADERRALERDQGITVHHDDVDSRGDLGAVADQIAGCDLVVSIANATVHLTGALGVPCWVMLPWIPNWCWMLRREDSPWYHSVKLYRPPAMDAWRPVLDRVSRDLDAVLAGDRSRLAPARWDGPPATEP